MARSALFKYKIINNKQFFYQEIINEDVDLEKQLKDSLSKQGVLEENLKMLKILKKNKDEENERLQKELQEALKAKEANR